MPLHIAFEQFETAVFINFIKDTANRRIYSECHEALGLAGQKMKEQKLAQLH